LLPTCPPPLPAARSCLHSHAARPRIAFNWRGIAECAGATWRHIAHHDSLCAAVHGVGRELQHDVLPSLPNSAPVVAVTGDEPIPPAVTMREVFHL